MRKRKCRIRTAAILGVIGILLGLSFPVFAGGEELTPEMEMWLNGDSIQSGIVFDSDYGWTPGKDNAYYGSSLENGVMDEVVYEEHSVPFRNGQVGSFTYQNCKLRNETMLGLISKENPNRYAADGYYSALTLEDGSCYQIYPLKETFHVNHLAMGSFHGTSFQYEFEGQYQGVPLKQKDSLMFDEPEPDYDREDVTIIVSTSGTGYLGDILDPSYFSGTQGMAFLMVLDEDSPWTAQIGTEQHNLIISDINDVYSFLYSDDASSDVPYQNFYQMPVLMIGDLEFESRHGQNQEEYPGLTETEDWNDVAAETPPQTLRKPSDAPVAQRGWAAVPVLIAGAAGSFAAAAAGTLLKGNPGQSKALNKASKENVASKPEGKDSSRETEETSEEKKEEAAGELIINEGEDLPVFLTGVHLIYPVPVRVENSECSLFRWNAFCISDDKALDISVSVAGMGQQAELLISLAGNRKEDYEAVIHVSAVPQPPSHSETLHGSFGITVRSEGLTVEPVDGKDASWCGELVCPGVSEGLAEVIDLKPGNFDIILDDNGTLIASAERNGKKWTTPIQKSSPDISTKKEESEHGKG